VRKRFYLYRNGILLLYDANTLFEYILTSGDLCDPLTRGTYQSHELMRLVRISGRVLPDRLQLQELRGSEIARRELLTYLTDNTGIVSVEALDNLRDIATPSELNAVYDLLTRNNIVLQPLEPVRNVVHA
jgi:hypothetical protein